MDRLTGKDSRTGLTTLVGFEGVYDSLSVPNALAVENALDKLAAYEDTGLSPEELDNLYRQMSEIRTSLGFKTLDDVYKLVSEGRLIVLPCKVGDKFYLIDKLCNKLPGLCNYGGRCSDCEGNKPFISECSVQTLPQAVAILDAVGKTVFLTREEAQKALEAEK